MIERVYSLHRLGLLRCRSIRVDGLCLVVHFEDESRCLFLGHALLAIGDELDK